MALQFVVNIILAFVWMIFLSDFSVADFVIGYALGLVLLYSFRKILKLDGFYFTRVVALVKLIAIFARELFLSNLDVMKIVLRPKINTRPGIVAVPTVLTANWQRTLLASLISLTPGTMPIAFSEDGSIIYVHYIHTGEKEQMIRHIKETFEKAIQEVFR